MHVVSGPAHAARARKDLRVVPVSPGTPFPRAYKMYVVNDAGGLVVPLFWAAEAGLVELDPPRLPPPSPGLADFAAELRETLHQPEASRAVQAALSAKGGGVLCLPTGFGKTTTALHVAHALGVKTAVLVHKGFLADQWAERVAQVLPRARVSRVQGPERDFSGDVVVVMIQTLVSRQYDLSNEGIGLLIVDEVHHIAAEAFSNTMFLTAGIPRRLGLSATPVRKDGLTRVLHWFFGPTAFSVERTAQANVRVLLEPYDCAAYRLPPPVNRRGDVCYASLMSQLVNDPARTRAVASRAADLARAGRQVLVLSHRRGHCADLAACVNDLVGDATTAATYLGGDAACPGSRVVCATYSLASEGFDCPRLDALVLATPASDVNQSCGRILRGNETTSKVIVDVVDAFGIAYAQAAKRRAFYRKAGFDVVGRGGGGGGGESSAIAEKFDFVDDP
jgi:hypothetical protein